MRSTPPSFSTQNLPLPNWQTLSPSPSPVQSWQPILYSIPASPGVTCQTYALTARLTVWKPTAMTVTGSKVYPYRAKPEEAEKKDHSVNVLPMVRVVSSISTWSLGQSS